MRVTAWWSCFEEMLGEVMQITPHVMVLLDGDRSPMRFGEQEIEPHERD